MLGWATYVIYLFAPGLFALMSTVAIFRVARVPKRVYLGVSTVLFGLLFGYWMECTFCSMVLPKFVTHDGVYVVCRCALILLSVGLFGRFLWRSTERSFVVQEIPKLVLTLDYLISESWGRYYGP